MRDRFNTLLSVIKEAGKLALTLAEQRPAVHTKAANDFVTEADSAVEAFIRKEILTLYPDDGFFGEESGTRESHDRYLWIVDPIDGTVNYMNTFPWYTVSIALEKDGTVVAGAVYAPFYDELYSALKGEGASLNGKRIRSMEGLPLERTLALVVPPHRVHRYLDEFWALERQIYELVSDTRSIGSAAMSLCQVACGRCSAYYEWFLHIYDYAAGLLIAQEAGCDSRLVDVGDGTYKIFAWSEAYKDFEEVPL